jgi:hypothetical protein
VRLAQCDILSHTHRDTTSIFPVSALLRAEIFIWSTLSKRLPSCDGECIGGTFRMLLPARRNYVKDSSFGRCIFSFILNTTLDLHISTTAVNDVHEVSVFHNFKGEIRDTTVYNAAGNISIGQKPGNGMHLYQIFKNLTSINS